MTNHHPDDHADDGADAAIQECLNLESPKSFFLYAGAGSGKTRSLVDAIKFVCRTQGQRLSLFGQKIGVITFTNAACDEIKQRLEFDLRVEVSTIHSFAWSLIDGHDRDIRIWLDANLATEIAQLVDEQTRGRAGTKATADRARSIEGKIKRRAALGQIPRFIYSPTSANRTWDALTHSEVIAMTASFLTSKPGLQRLLVARFPILLIDESQDTNQHLMDALIIVQERFKQTFCLGLFGDTMQRIYADGKVGLAEAIPETWARPVKKMNHRCAGRVIRLINKIRAAQDDQEQRGRKDKDQGHVRLFVLPESHPDKFAAEADIAVRMAAVSSDEQWRAGAVMVKTLTLEHHMAARRFGFEEMFNPLYRVDRFRTGLLDGTLPGLVFFAKVVLPTVLALRAGDRFRVGAIVRSTSPMLDPARLAAAGEHQIEVLRRAKVACDELHQLCSGGNNPSFLNVLRHVATTGLFPVPESLDPFVEELEVTDEADDDNDEDATTGVVAWRAALNTSFFQIQKYDEYIRGVSSFDTHQGVKGREFPRVMVIISDEEARGFLFSYDKLFGVKEKTKTDLTNEQEGRETSIQRTQRLLYVTCSRAEKSLAIVYYTDKPDLVWQRVIDEEWFDKSEVELIRDEGFF